MYDRDNRIAFAIKNKGKLCKAVRGTSYIVGKLIGYSKNYGNLILKQSDSSGDGVCRFEVGEKDYEVFYNGYGVFAGQGYHYEVIGDCELTEDERKDLKKLTEELMGWEP